MDRRTTVVPIQKSDFQCPKTCYWSINVPGNKKNSMESIDLENINRIVLPFSISIVVTEHADKQRRARKAKAQYQGKYS
jgi:hypothetical protein